PPSGLPAISPSRGEISLRQPWKAGQRGVAVPTAEPFGTTADGQSVGQIAIAGGGLTAHILTYGAIVRDLRLEGHHPPLVLGFERLVDYLDHSLYFGAIVGRYANRIAGGKFILDGERFETDANDNGNTLHGGIGGLDRRVWRV